MKKKAPALAGLLAVAIFAAIQLLQPQIGKPVSGEAEQMGNTLATSNSVSTSGTITDSSTTITSSTVKKSSIEAVESTAVEGKKDDALQSAAVENNPIKIPENEGIEPDGYIRARVTKVTDGDTIRVEYEGKEYRVRLLDKDTPETVKAGVPAQPYGKKASDKLKEMLLEKEITLVFEKDIDDRYDRLLAYVFLEDGTCVNAFMVKEGYARVEVVKPNTAYKDYFTKLQENAIREKRGLWSLPEKDRPFILNKSGIYIPRYYKEAA